MTSSQARRGVRPFTVVLVVVLAAFKVTPFTSGLLGLS